MLTRLSTTFSRHLTASNLSLRFFFIGLLLIGNTVKSEQSLSNKTEVTKKPIYIALIIDDLGYKSQLDHRALALPGNITFAILPLTTQSRRLAERAHKQHRPIMLHLPMQSKSNKKQGPGGTTIDMSKDEFQTSVIKSINSVPYISGVNNHMGSLLTQSETHMQWLMEILRAKKLFFVDSRTSALTVAEKIAKQNNIPNTRRHVFLDHDKNSHAIHIQFNRLIRLGKKYGSALGIGHPFPTTLSYLEERLPQLEQEGITLISVQQLIFQQQQQQQLPRLLQQQMTTIN